MPAFKAVPVLYTYMLDDLAEQGRARDRQVAWMAAGFRQKNSDDVMPWVPDAETGGRRYVDELIGITEEPEDELVDDGTKIDGIPANLWMWAAMTQEEVGGAVSEP